MTQVVYKQPMAGGEGKVLAGGPGPSTAEKPLTSPLDAPTIKSAGKVTPQPSRAKK